MFEAMITASKMRDCDRTCSVSNTPMDLETDSVSSRGGMIMNDSLRGVSS